MKSWGHQEEELVFQRRCQWMTLQQADLARDLELGAGDHTLPESFLFQCNPRVIAQEDRLAGITVVFFVVVVPVNNLATLNTSFCAVHYLF